MRRPLTFCCEGDLLAGMAHPAGGTTAVLIVTGGVQTRAGSHRGFVKLGDRLATTGYPALRFDHRGIGDSDGVDPGFRNSAPDIAAAVAALRCAFPQVRRVVGWGLCDGASALALHGPSLGLDGMILVNPWTRDSDASPDLPPRAAIASRYRERLMSPREWVRLARNGINMRKAVQGLLQLAKPEPLPALASAMVDGLMAFDKPVLVLLAGRDATAQAFAALWRSAPFSRLRSRSQIAVHTIADASHTFARTAEAEAMEATCLAWIAGLDV